MTWKQPLDYLAVLLLGLLLFFPNRGSHALWDDDEAHNAECAREMAEAETWIVPSFNFQLRTDKPVLLYWAIMASTTVFGVNEAAARLPSAVAGLCTLLVVYEFGRRVFSRATGLVAAIVLGTSLMFAVASHAVTPDALLILFTTASLVLAGWGVLETNPWWFVAAAIPTGLAVLAKGPIGIALPGLIAVIFILWEGRWRLLLHPAVAVAMVVVMAVAVPWYALVGVETRGDFLRGFFLKHNFDRFLAPMEGHRGPIWYHVALLLVTFAPWSAWLGLVVWHTWNHGQVGQLPWHRETNIGQGENQQRAATRLLSLWIVVWITFFSFASTKLPNYVLPAFPPLALLTAATLCRWWSHEVAPARWLQDVGIAAFSLTGIVAAVGIVLVSGAVELSSLRGRTIPGLLALLPIALLPTLAAGAAWWVRQKPAWVGVICSFGAIGFTAGMAAFGPPWVESQRAVRTLTSALHRAQTTAEYQLGCHPSFYRASTVYYTRREVQRLWSDQHAIDLLRSPLPAFVLMTEAAWERLSEKLEPRVQVVARAPDITAGRMVVLVGNQVGTNAKTSPALSRR